MTTVSGDRIAKVMARSGLCSRREAEAWIAAGRVVLNGKTLTTPAVTVGPSDRIEVDGAPLPARERTRLWLYHKPRGVLTAARDPEGRPVLRDALPEGLKAVNPVGRLDFNTEGLLLLTNDGGLKRVLELPSTGWLRRYRVRAFGSAPEDKLDAARKGMTIEGVQYGPMEVAVERQQGDNQWLTVGLREGKNREVKVVLGALGLQVNRLIRISYGPFKLGKLEPGAVQEIRSRVLRDQLGGRLIDASGADFDAPLRQDGKPGGKKPARGRGRSAQTGEEQRPRALRGFIDKPNDRAGTKASGKSAPARSKPSSSAAKGRPSQGAKPARRKGPRR